MATRSERNAVTRIEVLVLVVVLGVAGSMLVGYLAAAQAAARRTTCTNNMKELGLGTQNYASANNNRFPGSADLIVKGEEKKVGGWSLHVKLLPYMEYGELYDKLARKTDPESDDAEARKALQRSIPEFVCPDNCNSLFLDPKASPPTGALTNYKGMGATCQQSLAMVLGKGTAPYNPSNKRLHPDGAMYPATGGIRMADLPDGTSMTILCAETMDDKASRWTVGREATVLGMPNATLAGASLDPQTEQFFAPKGFDGQFGPESAVSKAGLRTYLSYDFMGKDAGKYEDPAFGRPPAAYGPSSNHQGMVNHLFGDGSVRQIKDDVDAAAYMFLITKNGGDPNPPDDCVAPKRPRWQDLFGPPTKPAKTGPSTKSPVKSPATGKTVERPAAAKTVGGQ
jgi:type II secretory pathway pseudopilin PulG